jgi:thiol-disulfide isomerase/thioredoxin
MLVIALMGRKIIGKLGFLARHTEGLRKAFGVLILGSVAFIASGVNGQSLPAPSAKTTKSQSAALKLENGLPSPYAAPEFSGIDAWFNSPPLTTQSLKGKVVLIDFWTYSCINCVRTLPYLTDWDKKYREQGLVIVGVHAPEFEFEKKADNVAAAIAQHGIRYPVALDNQLDTWSNFNNRSWPAHYLIDRDGKVVYTHFGEGEYEATENNIRYLLGLNDQAAPRQAQVPTYSNEQTPETYLGYGRADSFGGKERIVRDGKRLYRFPGQLPESGWALSGQWQVGAERITAGESGSALRLNFKARKVFLVLGTASGKPLRATIRVNGKVVGGKDAPDGEVTVARNTLYELVDQKTLGKGLLEIQSKDSGLEAYAFTFGS